MIQFSMKEKNEAKMTPESCMTRRMAMSIINRGRLRYGDSLTKKKTQNGDSLGTVLLMNCVRRQGGRRSVSDQF